MEQLFIICLRAPAPNQVPDDPFWEFGSFGRDPRRRPRLLQVGNPCAIKTGTQIAFAQEGPLGTRLLYVTPKVEVVRHVTFKELTWQPGEPFGYSKTSPLLIDDVGRSEFPHLKRRLADLDAISWTKKCRLLCNRTPWPVGSDVADEVLSVYAKGLRSPLTEFADTFLQALPFSDCRSSGEWVADERHRLKQFEVLSSPFELMSTGNWPTRNEPS